MADAMSSVEQHASDGGQNLNAAHDIHLTINNFGDLESLIGKLSALNVPQLVAAAETEKRRRTGRLGFKFWRALESRNAIHRARLNDPGVQAALTDGINAYVRTGNDETLDVLANLLAERALITDINIQQFCVDDAIQVASRVDRQHLNALSMLLFVSWTTFECTEGVQAFYHNLAAHLIPFGESLSISEVDVRYLESTGCTTFGTAPHSIPQVLWSKYQGFYTPGFDIVEQFTGHGGSFGRDDILAVMKSDNREFPAIIPCLRDAAKLQVNGIYPADIEAAWSSIENKALRKYVRDQSNTLRMSVDKIRKELIDFDPRFRSVIDNYSATSLDRAVITAKGIALAYGHAKQVLGPRFEASLDLWLSPLRPTQAD